MFNTGVIPTKPGLFQEVNLANISMKSLFLISLLMFSLPRYISWVHIGNNNCRDVRSRSRSRSESYSDRYDSYSVCGWWNCCRCHRYKYRTLYRAHWYTEYYYIYQCCSGYQQHRSVCKRTVLGFEKNLYYLEDKANSVRICAKKYVNDMSNGYDDQTHTLNYRVTLHGQTAASGHIALPPSMTRNCAAVPINREYRTSGDLQVSLTSGYTPNYAIIQYNTTIIRPRKGIIIGFDQTQMDVYEDVNNISVCYGIRSPQDLSPTEYVDFYFTVSTRSDTGHYELDFNHTSLTRNVSKYFPRQCSSVSIIHDHIHETSEEFSMELVGIHVPQYVTFSPSTTRVKIINERRNLTIGFDLHELEILENAGSEEICIGTSEDTTYLHHGLSLEVIIPLAYEKDIALSNSVVQFDGAVVRQCLTLNITNDIELEGNEEIVLTLEVNSTTQPFYMEVNPSFMMLRIIDDDSIVIGFDSSVIEVRQDSVVRVCASIHSEPFFAVDVSLRVTSQDLTADSRHYSFPGGTFSTRFPENCFTGSTFLLNNTDRQPKTFLVSLTNNKNLQKVILNPQSILVKITYEDASSCLSGSYQHEELSCSGSCNWHDSNTTVQVSDDVCISMEANKKYREPSPYCTSEGLLCSESVEEKIIRSFNLGISPQMSRPEAATGACNNLPTRLDCTTSVESVQSSEKCQPDQPSLCSSRSILFILDASSSVGLRNFKMTTEAMSELTLHFCGDVQVAVAKYNRHSYFDLCFDCLTKSRFELSRFIKNSVEYNQDGAGHTNFGSSARCILDEAFNRRCGDHTHSDCVDIIYVTDGEGIGDACAQSWLPPQDHICNKSRVLVIGVGQHVNVTGLQCIASPSSIDKKSVFQFDNFAELQEYVSSSVQYLYKKRKLCNSKSTGSICDRNRIDLACRG